MSRYMIPSPNGALSEGKRIFNWVWYRHYAFNSEQYNDLMTDNVTNEPHRYTLPLGRLRTEHAMALKKSAKELLAPCISELIQKTHQPFIQAITDLVSPKAAFFGGKVLLAGDALATLRPMSGLGLNSAARSSIMLLEVLEGRMSIEEWEEEAFEFARKARLVGLKNSEIFSLRKSSEEAAEAERNIVRVPRMKI
jgi:2-polyprenyl-6-methoxyphenol hydroxylase-like FAD-dependent oxidoreductase